MPSIELGIEIWIDGVSMDVIFVEEIRIDAENGGSSKKSFRFNSYHEVSIIVSPIEFLHFICRGGV